MTLATILNKVEEITVRPDARAKGLLSLNNLIQDICNNADYPEDLIETTVLNPTPGEYTSTVSLALSPLPDVRKIEYVLAGGKPQKSIKPRNAVCQNGCPETDTYYRAGSNIHIYASTPFDIVYLGYYQHTGYLAESATHWLETKAEHLLVLGTAAAVFRATGDDTSASEYEAQYRMMRQQFRRMIADSEDL